MPGEQIMSVDDGDGATPRALSVDERAAIRAFLQRSEVRLSTMHRVASALLSGAGLMVLLPAVERDAVVDVLRSLLTGRIEVAKVLTALGVVLMLSLPFTALWMVLRDLIQFYFHSNHLHSDQADLFVPRFTLTGLRLPLGELDAASTNELEAARADAGTIELLVPANDRSRAEIDQRIVAYGGLGTPPSGASGLDDAERADALFVLAASRQRDLFNEVAKVEHGMARHVLRTQTLVLRYVKALLVLLTTAMATFGAAAVVDGKTSLTGGDVIWLAGIMLTWAPLVIVAVTSPVRWLDRLLRSEGATSTAVSEDPEMTRVELLAIRLAVLCFASAIAAVVVEVAREASTVAARRAGTAAAIISTLVLLMVLRAWSGRRSIGRLLARPVATATVSGRVA